MTGIPKAELVNELKLSLKSKGYKKKNLTWVKFNDDVAVVVNIQGSQYDTNDYYVNLGVYIKPMGSKEVPCISDCHLRERVDVRIKSTALLISIIDKWAEWYGTADRIREKINEDRMPMLTDKKIYAYFLTL